VLTLLACTKEPAARVLPALSTSLTSASSDWADIGPFAVGQRTLQHRVSSGSLAALRLFWG